MEAWTLLAGVCGFLAYQGGLSQLAPGLLIGLPLIVFGSQVLGRQGEALPPPSSQPIRGFERHLRIA
ncbi:hypothetical protein D8I35_00220 [Corticibacter populi]|uniref:Uncharacterized protein n=1 Tax=Corticibacter populi TaxID=1550736 RepID=A0A3M6QX67_9BURK|nr:hypothetical protein [Corticibacter populi]RMX07615.1 hypothetical protein D8I35_00220 [Corticibacter populi]